MTSPIMPYVLFVITFVKLSRRSRFNKPMYIKVCTFFVATFSWEMVRGSDLKSCLMGRRMLLRPPFFPDVACEAVEVKNLTVVAGASKRFLCFLAVSEAELSILPTFFWPQREERPFLAPTSILCSAVQPSQNATNFNSRVGCNSGQKYFLVCWG